MLGLVASMYTTLLSIFIVTCQYAWPTAFFVIPLGWLNIWYRVGIFLIPCYDVCSLMYDVLNVTLLLIFRTITSLLPVN